MRGTRDSPSLLQAPSIHDDGPFGLPIFWKRPQPSQRNQSNSPSRLSPPFTRQLSTPEQPRCSSPFPELPYVEFLMSLAMAAAAS